MIKSSQYNQINTNDINLMINVSTNELKVNYEDGFVLIPSYGVNQFFSSNVVNSNKQTLVAYKPAEDSGNPVASAGFSGMAAQLIPGLGALAHLLETVNHVREFSEQIFDDAGRRVEVIIGGIENAININPKDALNPSKAFLPMTPFTIPEKPQMEYWKQKRIEDDETKEKIKKQKNTIKSL